MEWHLENGRFYDEYRSDLRWLKVLNVLSYASGVGGMLIMGMVVNPNVTSSRAFYLRKFNVAFGFGLFYLSIKKFYNNHYLFILGKMHDYFPWEVKRALVTGDYRYIKLLDLDNFKQSRKIWDEKTGKSLS